MTTETEQPKPTTATKKTVSEVSADALTSTMLETSVCPKCGSIDFTEYTEPAADVTSVQKVGYEQVDALLAKGYKIERMDANSAVLTLKTEAS